MKIVIKAGLTIALCFYLLVLSKLILFKYLTIQDIISLLTLSFDGYYWNSYNFIPFKTITYYLFLANDINFNIRVENLTGNIIGFIPFGFILPLLSSKFQSFKKITVATFCLSLAFELLQLIFRFGSFDVDDLILNTLGGMIGYISIKLIKIVSVYINHSWGGRRM
ncbi:VanZ family protein [Oceanobacillus chungangensis]|uniref:VanZ family protein n=1 Tax=Oceanobacillus chungangensis TaxID=1229152 RepID=A0A3D8PU49_9BACI|nr:VanZ family protein [Oceanobacillus chungangensis]RDW19646.1 VanZ family protein [Oceanobacillus chungangensis]